MRSAEFAVQPGQTFDSNLEEDAQPHLTRGDLSFFTNEEGVMCAAIMMRPCTVRAAATCTANTFASCSVYGVGFAQ